MIFQGSGGRSWPHFPMFFGCLFQDRFLIVLGSVLGLILEPYGFPNGFYFEGFGGSGLGSILGWFLGGGLGPPKISSRAKSEGDLGGGGGPTSTEQIADLRTQIT